MCIKTSLLQCLCLFVIQSIYFPLTVFNLIQFPKFKANNLFRAEKALKNKELMKEFTYRWRAYQHRD